MQKYGGFDDLVEQVYFTAIGEAVEGCRAPGVIDQYGPEGKCHQLYCQVRDAYKRICVRLGVCDGQDPDEIPEDGDLDDILNLMDDICKEVGCEMFRCGALFQQTPPDAETHAPNP